MSPILRIKDLTLAYGGLKVLRGITFDIPAGGGVFGLIGPNGAGKTSLLNCISRIQRPTEGRMEYEGRDLMGCPIHKLAMLGITRSFQNLELFDDATVLENVLVGCSPFHRAGFLSEILRLPSAREGYASAMRQARAIIEKMNLDPVADTLVSELPFGTRKVVEFARALAAKPKLLLLDEPAAGLNGAESKDLGIKLNTLAREHGSTILMVEHDMALVMNYCDQVIALVHGEIVCQGNPAEVRQNETVINAYLGEEEEHA